MIEKRKIGDSGIEVAPLALGGNVFGWTADEKTSFAVLDAFVDAGGTMIDTADVYSAWVPGHEGGESETVIGRWLKRDPAQARQGRDRDQGRVHGGDWRRRRSRPPATRRCGGSGSRRSTFTTSTRTTPTSRSPTASARWTRWCKAGKIRAIGLSQYSRRAAASEAMRRARRERLCSGHARSRPGTISSSARSSRAAARRRARATGSGSSLSTASPTASSPASTGPERTSRKSTRGDRVEALSRRQGDARARRAGRDAAETGAPLAAIALAWTMAQPGIVATLASATSVAPARRN